MEEPKLDPLTELGFVSLTVSDLRRSVEFYQRSLGFKLHGKDGVTAYLGTGGRDLLIVTEHPGAVKFPRTTGLYHFAILTPSRKELGHVLHNLIETETPLQGGADHLVSEAIYLADPDGNGIEIYRDRPRQEWEYDNGTLIMGTDPLDFKGILAEPDGDSASWIGLNPETRLGHMHLHVADLREAADFYEKVLGFDLQLYYGASAAFLSAGGYHHHIGINTWNGAGVPPPPPDSIGLRYFSVQLTSQTEVERLIERLDRAEAPYENGEKGLLVRDPSQNGVLFQVNHQRQ
jgi:catechol 2,3-dioxygenase